MKHINSPPKKTTSQKNKQNQRIKRIRDNIYPARGLYFCYCKKTEFEAFYASNHFKNTQLSYELWLNLIKSLIFIPMWRIIKQHEIYRVFI
ncbi:hypothetical protein, partial [Enterobacter kobei]|uniref:hypothetical protein n=1 Tax=Enterobacter kobei TaxID=208224 RepID=UPI003D6E508C